MKKNEVVHDLEYYDFDQMEDKIYKMYDICKELANVEVIPGCDEHLARLKEESIQVLKKIESCPYSYRGKTLIW